MITDQDIDLGTVVLGPGVNLSGSIRMADSRSELPPTSFGLTPVNATVGGANTSVTTAGPFTFSNVSDGQYWLNFRTLPRGVYVSSVRYGARAPDIGDIAVSKESEGPIEIVLATGNTLTGTVRNERGDVLPYGAVLIYPSRGRQHPSSFKTAEADKNGSFVIYGVAPGEYRVLAWEDALPSLHRDPKFLSGVEQRGTQVTVQSGSAPSVEVKAVPTF
jgi:hypothetical protein